MSKLETRRINPIAHIALVAVVILIVFEGFVIFGALEMKAQTVARYAPWAYEPFLKLVGEHFESAPRWAVVDDSEEDKLIDAVGVNVTGLNPSAIPVLIETNEMVLATNLVIEATVPLEVKPEPIPVVTPTNESPAKPEEMVPVG